ncbi:MAG TPA: error-prone DNA polymerase [Verrucomicrobiae bacterium]|nr:error-prone DNA polymerase [Verrucomicrobiae bacterium]
MTDYVELHCRSAFSFLRGASTPERLAARAEQLQLSAVALCDRDGLYGAPRFFSAAKEVGIRPIVGAELTIADGTILPVLVQSRRGYENLSQLLTRAHLRNEKGKSSVRWDELPEFSEGLVALANSGSIAKQSLGIFGCENLFIEIQRHRLRGEEKNVRSLVQLAEQLHLPLLATNGVLYSTENERPILDVFNCIRHHTHLDAAGKLLEPNGERYLKNAAQMRELFHDFPEAISNTVRLAERLDFTLENLGYEFPNYPIPMEHTMDSFLREQTFAGAQKRYGKVPEKVRTQLENELVLIAKLKVAGYFLIVWDIVEFCRRENIMAQGRGSAANSTVCFCLGITNVDPLKFHTLFERFLTEGRKNCWPDIDIDLPSGDRRERVIQEIYKRYGERGAAMTANVITYRGRSAAREVGKALNLSPDILNRFSNLYANGDFPHTLDLQMQMEKSGLPKSHPRAAAFATMCKAIRGLPRHLGQHSGGMIICQGKLDKIVPLENASMPGRIVAQWDKDDCEDLGIIKVDFLGLGMMSVLQDAVELCRKTGREMDLAHLPPDDPKTFEMMATADTIGVFQIESRAQMATLPRMKPKTFYDLVIEVAIIRPGPIQGRLMHPYLARRAGQEKIEFYHDDLKPVLERTLGVPLFQEQMLQMAMVMADFSGAEAEELRRALSFHRSDEKMQRVEKKLRAAMERKGHAQRVIDDVCKTVSSFALYGFPESHAISFAHLAYASAYLKAHRAPEFFANLLNNQPMGFYSPATLIKDGQRHGVKFLPVDVMKSDWECAIEPDNSVRLGLCVIKILSGDGAKRILAGRKKLPFLSLEDFKRRSRLNKNELRTLAETGALNCFAEHRREALWNAEKKVYENDLFAIKLRPKDAGHRMPSPLAPMNYAERIQADFAGMNLTTGKHPMALLRPKLKNILRAADLPKVRNGKCVRIAGNVICRQRPGTAKGFVFISLEDETGISNAVVAPPMFEAHRLLITEESFLLIEGKLQNIENVIHVKAEKIQRFEHGSLAGSDSYDFH